MLGQCLEVLRANQQKVAVPATPGHRRRLAVVPFRHSKLTEIFQNFFVGDGCAIMIVHVNPCDTGYDENAHVMRFSAVAREIQTTTHSKSHFPTLKRQISTQINAFKSAVSSQRIKVVVPVMPKGPSGIPTPVRRTTKPSLAPPPTIPERASSRPTATRAAATRVAPPRVTTPPATVPEPGPKSRSAPEAEPEVEIEVVEEEIEVVEEEPEDDDEDDEKDYFVDYLFEQLKELKAALYESEMRNASLEVEIREEASRDMQETIQRMQADFNKRLLEQMASGEEKADMKIDILQRTMHPDSSFEDSFISANDETTVSKLTRRRSAAYTHRILTVAPKWARPPISQIRSRCLIQVMDARTAAMQMQAIAVMCLLSSRRRRPTRRRSITS